MMAKLWLIVGRKRMKRFRLMGAVEHNETKAKGVVTGFDMYGAETRAVEIEWEPHPGHKVKTFFVLPEAQRQWTPVAGKKGNNP
jgi:hypothetical protein